jgi:hypothetical protein
MKYSEEKIEKLIKFIAEDKQEYCPSDVGLKDSNCRISCTDCWKQALAGEKKCTSKNNSNNRGVINAKNSL